ncbi:hypothetical protein [Erwinia amylovora]
MRKARFTEHQIIAVIKPVESGRPVKNGREFISRALAECCLLYTSFY